jgi:dTDP-glucose 4,6-dehydratase
MSDKKTVLITGAAGFVGHHMVEHLLKNTDWVIIGMDSLTYAGTWDRLRDINIDLVVGACSAYDHPRFTPMNFDFRNEAEPNLIEELKEVTHVLHMGAESHVDNSITDPMRFVQSNIVGTTNMLELARKLPKMELFMYFSTDEVFGPAPMGFKELPAGEKPKDVEHYKLHIQQGNYTKDRLTKWSFKGFKERDVHDPKNPYAATKSAAEQLVVAYANTYRLPCIITRQMNIFGERQHPEKFMPICMNRALYGGDIFIHSTPDKTQAGMRHYIHARNVADAHLFILNKIEEDEIEIDTQNVESFHVVGEEEVDNLKLARLINEYTGIIGDELDVVAEGVTNFEMVDFHSSRPGHDLRYALDGSKMKRLGWQPPKTFHESLKDVIRWTLNNPKWMTAKESNA